MSKSGCVYGAVLLAGLVLSGRPVGAAEIVFEEGVEFSNPDGQHLKLNLARPKLLETKSPAVLCIHGGGFRAGKRPLERPVPKTCRARLRRRHGELSAGAPVSVSGGRA